MVKMSSVDTKSLIKSSVRLIDKNIFLKLAIVLSLFASEGCGFKLRGSVEMPFDSIFVASQGFSFFDTELRRVLASNETVSVVGQVEEADVLLTIINQQRDRTILSLSNAGNVREFELTYRVNYKIDTPKLESIATTGEIMVVRSLTYDDAQILAKEAEEALLFEEMQVDAVIQLMRRLTSAFIMRGEHT